VQLCVGAALVAPLCAYGGADTDAVTNAVAYLAAQQDASGLWGLDTSREKIDTLAAVEALDAQGGAQARMSALQAKGSLLLRLPEELETTLDLVIELTSDASADGQDLLDAQNADGGWGTAAEQQSDTLDTILAAEALLAKDLEPADGWDKTVEFLLGSCAEDGYWFLSDEAATGKLELSARVIRSLQALKDAGVSNPAAVDQAVSATLDLLRATFRADGRFSLSGDLGKPASPIDTAEVYRTLVRFDQPGLYSDSLALLESLQGEDGGWAEPGKDDQDVYTTAVVMRAFLAVTPPLPSARADLMVLSSAVFFSPAAPTHGDSVTITAIVFNSGEVLANNVDVVFSNGDPRAGGTQIGATQVIGSITPKGSATASVTLATAPLAAGPIVFAQADPDGAIAESDITNNIGSKLMHIEGLPDAGGVQGVDLYVSPVGVTFNDEVTGTVFLIGSPTVMLGVTIANLGDTDAGAFKLEITSGVATVARVSVPSLAAGVQTTKRIPWNPASGTHALTITADSESAIAEADETNNEANVSVDVIGATCTVIPKKYEDDTELDPPYDAYDIGRFLVATAYQDVTISLLVEDVGGAPARTAVMPLFEAGKYQWNVVNHAPGPYTVTATFAEAETGTVLDTADATFDILETTALREVRVSLPSDIVEGGAIQPIPVTVSLANGSNVDANWSVSWVVLNPAGAEIASSSSAETVELLGSHMSKTLTLAEEITGTFTDPGRYTVLVTAAHPSAEAATGTANFHLLPPLHLTVTNEVVPDEVAPLGKVRVRTVLRLSATSEATGLNIPAAIRDITVTPETDIVDNASSTSTIVASGIVNAIGEELPVSEEGAQMAVYVPYGTITGGSPAPGEPSNPQIRIFDIVDAQVAIQYAPVGGTLTSGQHSLTVMQFHQYYDGEDKWFGKNIGNAEIFIKGP